eukprot:1155812-Pelagomonas_calceolata.AAC.1
MIKAESRTGSLPMLGTPPSSQLPPILRTGANAGAFLMTAKAVLMWASILVQAVLFQATICGNLVYSWPAKPAFIQCTRMGITHVARSGLEMGSKPYIAPAIVPPT